MPDADRFAESNDLERTEAKVPCLGLAGELAREEGLRAEVQVECFQDLEARDPASQAHGSEDLDGLLSNRNLLDEGLQVPSRSGFSRDRDGIVWANNSFSE